MTKTIITIVVATTLLAAGCTSKHRIRVPARAQISAETTSCVQRCERRSDDFDERYDCMRMCPGVREKEASCPEEEVPGAMCYERDETDVGKSIVVGVIAVPLIVVAVAFIGLVVLIGSIDDDWNDDDY